MKRPPPTRPPARVPLTAMIDVVFLLLIFFIWTSRFDPPELPVAANASIAKTADPATSSERTGGSRRLPTWLVQIDLAADGELIYRVAGRAVDGLSAVEAAAAQLAGLPIPPPVVIAPGRDVPMQSVMPLHDSLRRAGLATPSLAAEQP